MKRSKAVWWKAEGQNRGRGNGVHGCRFVPDEIGGRTVDHVFNHYLNHGLTMAEAGHRVQPNIEKTTVSPNIS